MAAAGSRLPGQGPPGVWGSGHKGGTLGSGQRSGFAQLPVTGPETPWAHLYGVPWLSPCAVPHTAPTSITPTAAGT